MNKQTIKNKVIDLMIKRRWHTINQIIKENKYENYLEIGVHKGHMINQIVCDNITGVDLVNKPKLDDKIRYIQGDSSNSAKMFKDESFDIIFIDADHSYTAAKKDILAWLPKVRKGGVLAGHDFNVRYYGVIKAVDEVLDIDNIKIEDDSVWIFKKKNTVKGINLR